MLIKKQIPTLKGSNPNTKRKQTLDLKNKQNEMLKRKKTLEIKGRKP
jgi:hypothetical protein